MSGNRWNCAVLKALRRGHFTTNAWENPGRYDRGSVVIDVCEGQTLRIRKNKKMRVYRHLLVEMAVDLIGGAAIDADPAADKQ